MAKKRSLNRNHTNAARHFPSLRDEPGTEVYMFVQDVSERVFPYSIRRGGKFKVEVTGEDNERERALVLIRSLGDRHHQNFEEAMADAIHEIGRHLLWYGRAPYEILSAKEDPSIFLLDSFTARRLFNLHWGWLQIVPKADREMWKRSYTFLPKRDVWIVEMPDILGGRRGYRAMLRKLNRFTGSGPKFWRSDLGRGKPLFPHFNFLEYRREIEIFESRITRQWGWNRRDFSDRNWTEFMQFYRTLTFLWAIAVLREHILSEINSLLARLKILASISVSGIPTSQMILSLRNEMLDGRKTMGKAFEEASA